MERKPRALRELKDFATKKGEENADIDSPVNDAGKGLWFIFSSTKKARDQTKYGQYFEYVGFKSQIQRVMYFGKDYRGYLRCIRLLTDSIGLFINTYTICQLYNAIRDQDIFLGSNVVPWFEFVILLCIYGIFISSIIKTFRHKRGFPLDYRMGSVIFNCFTWASRFSVLQATNIFRTETFMGIAKHVILKTTYSVKKKSLIKALGNTFFMWTFHTFWICCAISAIVLKLFIISSIFSKRFSDWSFIEITLAVGYYNQLAAIFNKENVKMKAITMFLFVGDPGNGVKENELVIQQKFMSTILFSLTELEGQAKYNWKVKLWAISLLLTLTAEDLQELLADSSCGPTSLQV